MTLKPALRGGILAPALSFLDEGSPKQALRAYHDLRRREPRNVALIFNFANALAARGHVRQAESEYRQALKIEPSAPDVLNNLAALVGQDGRHKEAAELCDIGLKRAPEHAPLLRTRAHERLQLKQLDEALADVRTLQRVKPDLPDAWNIEGDILANQQKWGDAIAAFRKAVELSGNDRQYRVNLGSALAAKGDLEEAIVLFSAAVRENKRDVKTMDALAAAMQRLNRNGEAIRACQLVLKVDPTFFAAQNRIATCLLTMEKWPEAIVAAEAALKITPKQPDALYNLGMALVGARRYDEGVACFDEILAAGPQDDMALLNLGNALAGAGRVQDAIDAYTRMIERLPNWAGGYLNRGHSYGKHYRWDEALADYRKAVELEPQKKEHLYSIGNVFLHQGQFEEGWKGYEYRNKSDDGIQRRVPHIPVWDGEDLAGKRLLVFSEQGLGDNVQMARYLPLLQERGATVTFHGYPVLQALMKTSAPGLAIDDQPKPEDYDFQVATMSLPFKFGTRVDSVPQNIPYFTAEPERVAKWRERIGEGGFRIGINWQGNPSGKIDEGRSAPLKHFLEFAEIPGVRLISMQKNHGLHQLDEVPEHIKVELLGDDFDNGKDAFLDTLAVMANLDLVVTTDTSLVHVAGGFGAPLFVALKDNPDWRWMMHREDSPWYPTARLFRQTKFAVWDDVFERMAAAVRERVTDRAK